MPADLPADASTKQLTPEVVWAQRSSDSDPDRNFVYLTISVPDIPTKDMKLDLKPGSLNFTGHSETKKTMYHVEIDFYAEIDPEKSQVNHTARDVEMKLIKKELKQEYWPRLLKDAKKVHYLRTDFDKWVDEDEQDGTADDDMMNQFGGAGGMPGMGGDGGFGGLDFSKLGGGAGGMPDLGDMGGMGGEGDEEDDEDMPGLEEEGDDSKEENTKPASAGAQSSEAAGSSKVQEVE